MQKGTLVAFDGSMTLDNSLNPIQLKYMLNTTKKKDLLFAIVYSFRHHQIVLKSRSLYRIADRNFFNLLIVLGHWAVLY